MVVGEPGEEDHNAPPTAGKVGATHSRLENKASAPPEGPGKRAVGPYGPCRQERGSAAEHNGRGARESEGRIERQWGHRAVPVRGDP